MPRPAVKDLPLLLAAVMLSACYPAHVATGTAPATPAATFACMTTALTDLGFTITSSDAKTGFLRGQRLDPGSPEKSEYTDLDISIYTNRDGETLYMMQATRTHGHGTTDGLPTLDSDVQASDAVAKRCGKP